MSVEMNLYLSAHLAAGSLRVSAAAAAADVDVDAEGITTAAVNFDLLSGYLIQVDHY